MINLYLLRLLFTLPATIFEGILFFYALAKSGTTMFHNFRFHLRSRWSARGGDASSHKQRLTLMEIIVRDHLVYFCW